MKLTLTAGLVVGVSALASPLLAQPIDPHMTIGEQQGRFVLHYYGQLSDGTPCPPSPNALQYGFDFSGTLRTVHNAVLDSAADPSLVAMFERGAYCSIAFEGTVRFQTHHGTIAYMTPNAIESVEGGAPVNPDGTRPAEYVGGFTIVYYPIQCLVPPCPPGTYDILDASGKVLATQLATLTISLPTGEPETVSGQYLDIERGSGQVWLDGNTARIDLDAMPV